MTLREDLERLADAVPAPPVDPSTWARARRARRRDRSIVAAAALLTAVGIGAVLIGVPGTPRAETASTSPVTGVPDRLRPVPPHVLESGTASGRGWEVTDDPAIGVGVAAWVQNARHPVVVGVDGEYHVLRLPGFLGDLWGEATRQDAGLTLSPSGTKVAYAWGDRGIDGVIDRSGLAVMNLETGRLTAYALKGTAGTAVSAIAWSPNEGLIGWEGQQFDAATPDGLSGARPVAGVIDYRLDDVGPSLDVAGLGAVSVDDAGTVVVAATGRLTSISGRQVSTRRFDGPSEPRIAASPRNAVGWSVVGAFNTRSLDYLDQDDRRRRVPLQIPAGTVWDIAPVGWNGYDAIVATREYADDGQVSSHLRAVDTRTGRSRVVGDAEVGGPTSGFLSIATDRIVPRAITVPAGPAPDWPAAGPGVAGIAWRVGLALALVSGLVAAMRRRRHRPPSL